MPIITIIRGAFGAGPEVAERVAGDLGYPCVDREVLMEASNRYGIPEAKYEEVLESGPHWWERWRESLRLYRITLQAAMCEMGRDGKLVYHGHMGQELLPGVSHVLKVLLTAPLEYQVEKVREREGLDEAGGRRYVESVNKARSRRMEAIFGADWRDASRYDLVLNAGQMTIDTLARLIEDAAARPEYQKTAESAQAFADLSLTSRVQAALIVSPKTRNLNVRVRAAGGVVHVSGILTQPALQEEIVSVAREVPGTTEVETDFESPPVEYMFP